MGKILSINTSDKKRVSKKPVAEVLLKENFGIDGDSHAAPGDRQISLLMFESIERQRAQLKAIIDGGKTERIKITPAELVPGIYAENLTTQGIDLLALKIGDLLDAGNGLVLRVSKIGKECHTKCAIYQTVGDCVMPREGIFCEVVKGGILKTGDRLERR